MVDDPQMMATNVPLNSTTTGFLGTVWGRVAAILAAISLVIGIAIELQTFVRGNYEVENAKNNAARSRGNAGAATAIFKNPNDSGSVGTWHMSSDIDAEGAACLRRFHDQLKAWGWHGESGTYTKDDAELCLSREQGKAR